MKTKSFRQRLGVVLWVAALGWLGVSLASDAKDSGSSWRVVAASGQVEAASAMTTLAGQPAWQAIRRGSWLEPGTQVKTGSRGRVTLNRATTVMIVDPESVLELPVDDPTTTSVVQSSGSVTYEVGKKKTRHFEVVTPYLVAGVKGTTFNVAVNPQGAIVRVTEGLVEVTSSRTGDRMDLHVGEALRLDAHESSRMERISPREGRDDVDRRTPDDSQRTAADKTSQKEHTEDRALEISDLQEERRDREAIDLSNAADDFAVEDQEREEREFHDLPPVADDDSGENDGDSDGAGPGSGSENDGDSDSSGPGGGSEDDGDSDSSGPGGGSDDDGDSDSSGPDSGSEDDSDSALIDLPIDLPFLFDRELGNEADDVPGGRPGRGSGGRNR